MRVADLSYKFIINLFLSVSISSALISPDFSKTRKNKQKRPTKGPLIQSVIKN